MHDVHASVPSDVLCVRMQARVGAVISSVCLLCVCLQLASRLAKMDFQGINTVTIDTPLRASPETIPTLLLTALSLLEPLCSPDRELAIAPRTMTPQLVAVLPAVAAAAAGWRRLCVTGLKWPESSAIATVLPPLYSYGSYENLTDALLAQLVKWVPAVVKLSAARTSLTAAPARMPCERLKVLTLTVGQLVHQEGLVGEGVEWELEWLTVILTPEQVCVRTKMHCRNIYVISVTLSQ